MSKATYELIRLVKENDNISPTAMSPLMIRLWRATYPLYLVIERSTAQEMQRMVVEHEVTKREIK